MRGFASVVAALDADSGRVVVASRTTVGGIPRAFRGKSERQSQLFDAEHTGWSSASSVYEVAGGGD